MTYRFEWCCVSVLLPLWHLTIRSSHRSCLPVLLTLPRAPTASSVVEFQFLRVERRAVLHNWCTLQSIYGLLYAMRRRSMLPPFFSSSLLLPAQNSWKPPKNKQNCGKTPKNSIVIRAPPWLCTFLCMSVCVWMDVCARDLRLASIAFLPEWLVHSVTDKPDH